MENIDIITCLKKKSRTKRMPKKHYRKAKSKYEISSDK